MADFGPDIYTEHYHGQFHVAGFDVTTLLSQPGHEGGVHFELKAGWTDPSGVTMRRLAQTIFELHNGEAAVSIVGTTRPRSIGKAVKGCFDPLKHHSQSMYGAANRINDTYHPEVLLLAGQSAGGIAAARGGKYLYMHPDKSPDSPTLGVATIDTPGVFAPFTFEGPMGSGVAELMTNCMGDLRHLGLRKGAVMMATLLKSTSVFEALYASLEAQDLRGVYIGNEIAYLRHHGIPVGTVFHNGDVIPGAEVYSEFSLILEGGHMRFVVEPGPIAEFVTSMAAELVIARTQKAVKAT